MKLSAREIAILAGLGVGAFIVYKLWSLINEFKTNGQAFADKNPNLASLFISAGIKTDTGQIPDVTGTSGSNAEAKAFKSVVNDHSQGFYNAALQQTAYDDGLQTSLDEQGTDQWPWKNYDNWKSKGYPALPNADAVTVDGDGIYHNDYF